VHPGRLASKPHAEFQEMFLDHLTQSRDARAPILLAQPQSEASPPPGLPVSRHYRLAGPRSISRAKRGRSLSQLYEGNGTSTGHSAETRPRSCCRRWRPLALLIEILRRRRCCGPVCRLAPRSIRRVFSSSLVAAGALATRRFGQISISSVRWWMWMPRSPSSVRARVRLHV